VTEDVVAQEAALQLVPLSKSAHFPLKQVPVVLQVSDDFAVQMFCGSWDLSATAVQWPGAAFRLHSMQAPRHALSQHAPWAQKVDRHSVPTLHSAPPSLGPQEALVQNFPEMHWMLLLVQLL
jgi:hypothetical protein